MITLSELTHAHTASEITLNNINLHVKPATIAGIVGRSGAGKSTLLRCLNGLEKPQSGNIIIDHEDVTTLSKAAWRIKRRQIAMIFQYDNLLQTRNVYQNIALPFQIYQQTIDHTRIQHLLNLVGLTHKQQAYPAQLSGGERQRVAIARALVSQPKLLLADEPTSALDPDTSHAILNLLADVRDQLGVTIVMISHAMTAIKQICDHVTVLDQGHVIEQGDTLTIFSQAKHTLTRSLVQQQLAPMPSLSITPEPHANSAPLWRIWFTQQAQETTFIADLMQHYQVKVNILQAQIERIQDCSLGIMLGSVHGTATQIQAAKHYLQQQGHHVENCGYVID